VALKSCIRGIRGDAFSLCTDGESEYRHSTVSNDEGGSGAGV